MSISKISHSAVQPRPQVGGASRFMLHCPLGNIAFCALTILRCWKFDARTRRLRSAFAAECGWQNSALSARRGFATDGVVSTARTLNR
ncbi:unnamed protein product [Leptosia nina]|uniref:Uncharacterized protein n=1 Tax=Leptosia nina TaxID=320188 RepID=A0AAV1IVH3_9NEOP